MTEPLPEPSPSTNVPRGDGRPDDRALSAALEAALVRELLSTWKQLNAAYFRGAMQPPTIQLVPVRSRLGLFRREARVIEISLPLVLEQSWGAVLEVMKHEMAHQYVHEVLAEHGETAHGPAFRGVCERLGIDAAAAGIPATAAGATDERTTRIVERIARLLALATSPNRNEAEAAMTAAQRLMLKYNVEASAGPRRDYGVRHLGRPSGRVTEAERLLAMILGRYFFVEVIWIPVYRPEDGKRASILEIAGTAANLSIAEYVHGFLTHTSDQLWDAHRREQDLGSNRDRRVYISGVMSGFAEKLARERTACAEAGLVWVKDGDLGAYFRRRHPYIRNVRHAGSQKNEAYAKGKEAGRGIVLRRGVTSGADGGSAAAPALLPPRR